MRRTTISAMAERTEVPDDGELRCANHPNTPTRLRCGRCGKPICTRCAVTTSVGLRCAQCARGQPPVMYQTDAGILGRAVGAGLVAAVALGVAWGLLNGAGLGRSALTWDFWFALVVGFGVAEAISGAARRRRGQNLQLLAIAAVLLAFVASRAAIGLRASQALSAADISARLQGVIAQPTLLIFVALACLIAWRRFR